MVQEMAQTHKKRRKEMMHSNVVRAALGAGLGLMMAAASFATPAQAHKTPGGKTVLLVHGAWADGSSWSKVIPLLQAQGFQVVAVQIPLTSLADDVAATERAIALVTGPILLVGHSYGGVVISAAGNDPKVAGLMFVAAYAPDEGESGLSLAEANPTPIDNEITSDAYGFLKLTPTGIFQDFAQELPVFERNVLVATQISTSGLALGAPLTSNPAWKNKPIWFIVASHDRTNSPQIEQEEAQNMNTITITLPACHVVMLEDPIHVAEFIRYAAA